MPFSSSRILTRMIIREILTPFSLAFCAISAFMLLGRMLVLLQPLITAGVNIWEFLRFTAIMLPSFFGFAIPIATLLGNLLAFMRLSRDSEITALVCCGINFRQILMPVAGATCILWFISLFVSIVVVPASKTASKQFLREVTEKIMSRGLPARIFFNPVEGLTFYVDNSSRDGRKFQGVYISDSRKPDLSHDINARRGELATDDSGRRAMLILNDGIMTIVENQVDSIDYLKFRKYVLRLEKPAEKSGMRRGEMGLSRLFHMAYRADIPNDKRISCRIELQKRFAVPCGVLVMGLIAVPLGCLFGKSGVSGGIAIGLAAFLSYYMIMELSANLAESGAIRPEPAMWIPNIAAGALVLFLIRRLQRLEGGRR